MKRPIWLFMAFSVLVLSGLSCLSTLGGCCAFADSTPDSDLSPNLSCSALSTRVVSVCIVPGAKLPLPKEEVEYSRGGAFIRSEALLELTQHQLQASDGTIPLAGVIKVNNDEVTSYVVEKLANESDHALIRLARQQRLSCTCNETTLTPLVLDGMLAWLVTPDQIFPGRVYLVKQRAQSKRLLFFDPDSHSALDRPGLSGFPVFVGQGPQQFGFVGVNVGSADVEVTSAGSTHRERMKIIGQGL